ncbi:hypothetical protein TCAL_15667 [Tigriopus californicus]|uniref:Uncharacterized protein n=1 Tax=Tigriopus californicus TaxID=6832 RepID=A0A553PC82_TIGCA|nr:hypothetical protein TCAL_15667 [Tigriopus californicus]
MAEKKISAPQYHENSPRKRPPLSHGVQSIARVQPLVPEVSMWMSSHGILDRIGRRTRSKGRRADSCPNPEIGRGIPFTRGPAARYLDDRQLTALANNVYPPEWSCRQCNAG